VADKYPAMCAALSRYPLLRQGKVRDVYDLGTSLLIVATDRISCFDVVLPTPIPGKGQVLSALSRFWFEKTRDLLPNHFRTSDLGDLIKQDAGLAVLSGRAMIVQKAEPLPIEAIVRGYLFGSAWKEYQRCGAVCGIRLPEGMKESQKLPAPIFTPTTKAPAGTHDENINFEEVIQRVGKTTAEKMRQASLDLYTKASSYAAGRGIIIADTKFEFGLVDGRLTLIDEALTPDSSRFWPAAHYQVGKAPPSFDKQYVRDYLERLGWNKQPPAPVLPDQIVRETASKYEEARRLLTDATAGRPQDAISS
jgi:phosphoribosylaminoimidazole-succinocarboxamide synthase